MATRLPSLEMVSASRSASTASKRLRAHSYYGQNAKQFTSAQVMGKTVEVEEIDIDRYGRTVGLVSVGDLILNRHLIEYGTPGCTSDTAGSPSVPSGPSSSSKPGRGPEIFSLDLYLRNQKLGLSPNDLVGLFGPPINDLWTKRVRRELDAVTEENPKKELQRRKRRAHLPLNKNGVLRDRIRGCLLGVAIGDALGAPFEHVRPRRPIWRFKESDGRITDFQPYQGGPAGAWTDDTGMTLATCRGLLHAVKSGETVRMALRMAFSDWAGGPECRKAGKTVLRAAKEGIADPGSWANGALMRISPAAIYSHLIGYERNEAAVMAYDVARLTHGHPFATFPAVECTMAISPSCAATRTFRSTSAGRRNFVGTGKRIPAIATPSIVNTGTPPSMLVTRQRVL